MKKFVCSVCGYVYEGEAAPAECRSATHRQRSSRSSQGKDLGLSTLSRSARHHGVANFEGCSGEDIWQSG